MKIKTDEITSVLKQEIEQFGANWKSRKSDAWWKWATASPGYTGWPKLTVGELVEFDTSKGPVMGQVMNLELDTVGCVIYGDALAVQEGDTVKATTRLLEVPAGHGLLGRVVDLGQPSRRRTRHRSRRPNEARHCGPRHCVPAARSPNPWPLVSRRSTP